ncbi:MAG TPA: GTP-binding protein, partial [Nitrospirae bacterium]|nr:GTP-binding protein [Nitrospirota bacterium]
MKPIVAIVGRPNVGKSTLFNKIIGKKIAIVEDIPGLTRDRIYGEAEWSDRPFIVIDTGGFQPEPEGDIIEEVKKQAVAAVEEADIVLMMMDAKEGLMPSDAELSGMLRTYNKKILYVVNKIDGPRMEKAVYDFYSLGKDLFPVSAVSGFGFEELMDSIAEAMPEGGKEEQVEYPRIAIIGRPNVGKSTFTNSLLGKQR